MSRGMGWGDLDREESMDVVPERVRRTRWMWLSVRGWGFAIEKGLMRSFCGREGKPR